MFFWWCSTFPFFLLLIYISNIDSNIDGNVCSIFKIRIAPFWIRIDPLQIFSNHKMICNVFIVTFVICHILLHLTGGYIFVAAHANYYVERYKFLLNSYIQTLPSHNLSCFKDVLKVFSLPSLTYILDAFTCLFAYMSHVRYTLIFYNLFQFTEVITDWILLLTCPFFVDVGLNHFSKYPNVLLGLYYIRKLFD